MKEKKRGLSKDKKNQEMDSQQTKKRTRDNGGENDRHEETKNKFGVQSYFCDPYSSW